MGTPAEESLEAPPRPWLDRAIGPFLHEPLLWPVLLVLIGHVVLSFAMLLLLALRDGSGSAGFWLAACALGSAALTVWEWRWRGRPGSYAGWTLASWVLAAGAAWGADRLGAF